MFQTLLKEVREYKRASIATPLFMLLEVLMETMIPYLMASIIDKGVNAGDLGHIYRVGGLMIVAAAIGLFAGMAGRTIRGKSFCRTCQKSPRKHVRSYSDLFLCEY